MPLPLTVCNRGSLRHGSTLIQDLQDEGCQGQTDDNGSPGRHVGTSTVESCPAYILSLSGFPWPPGSFGGHRDPPYGLLLWCS
jgi:hypothetical protein